MPTTYDGNPLNYPDEITIPADGDGPIKAADVNVAFEGLADRTAALAGASMRPVTVEFLANGTFTLPANALPLMIVEGCGQGGGGGGGGNNPGPGPGPLGLHASGGGGGGGAVVSTRTLVGATVVPGDDYGITIGSTAGNVAAGADGSDGAATVLTHNAGPTNIALWQGGGGGQGGRIGAIEGLYGCLRSFGGGPIRSGGGQPQATEFDIQASPAFAEMNVWTRTPHCGGDGLTANFPSWLRGLNGSESPQGFIGGTPGAASASDDFPYRKGGGGGGGGAGPYGNGGDGGDGGTANAAGGSSGGLAGASGPVNSGAGGGGGGSSGGASGAGAGGSGHKGGSGRMRITYFVPTDTVL